MRELTTNLQIRLWPEPTRRVASMPGADAAKSLLILYVDPPWRYDFSGADSRAIENQYPTMSTDEICKMLVPQGKDAILFLWATAPKLRDALAVMDAWRFQYKTHAIWDKKKVGMGYWFRGQHELLLVGTRGKASPPPEELRIRSVISLERGDHSQKPDAFRDIISEWFPTADRIELFAREVVEGWRAWGNEVPGSEATPTPADSSTPT